MTTAIPLRQTRSPKLALALVDDSEAPSLAAYRWTLHSKGYAFRSAGGRPVLMHRQILGLNYGDPLQGDHINRNRLDNRRANLRIVTHRENRQNMSARGGSSPYRGVRWDRERCRWRAEIKQYGERYYLGRFLTEQEADRAVQEFLVKRQRRPLHVGTSADASDSKEDTRAA